MFYSTVIEQPQKSSKNILYKDIVCVEKIKFKIKHFCEKNGHIMLVRNFIKRYFIINSNKKTYNIF